jgi:hypothetical protein
MVSAADSVGKNSISFATKYRKIILRIGKILLNMRGYAVFSSWSHRSISAYLMHYELLDCCARSLSNSRRGEYQLGKSTRSSSDFFDLDAFSPLPSNSD